MEKTKMDDFYPALFLSLFVFSFISPILWMMYKDTSNGDNRAGTIVFAALMFAFTFAMSGFEISRHKEIKTATNSTASDIAERSPEPIGNYCSRNPGNKKGGVTEKNPGPSTTAAPEDKHAPDNKKAERNDEYSNILNDLSTLYALGFF